MTFEDITWYRQGGQGKPIYALIPSISCVTSFKKYHKLDYKIVPIYFRRGRMWWFFDTQHLKKMSAIFLRRFKKDPKYFEKIYRNWKKDCQSFYLMIDEVNTGNFRNLSDSELSKYLERFTKAFIDLWGYLVFIDSFDPFAEDYIFEILKKEKIALNAEKIGELLDPKPSYIAREKLDFLNIAKNHLKKKEIDLLSHQQKYYWISNNYGHVEYLTVKDFYRRLSEYLKDHSLKDIEKEIKRLSQDPQTKIKIPLPAKKYFNLFRSFAEFRDERKEMNVRGITALRFILYHISKRLDIDVGTLEYYAPFEIKKTFSMSRMELFKVRERKEGHMWLIEKGNYEMYPKEQADQSLVTLNKDTVTEEITGNVVTHGTVKGRVKIITLVKEFYKLEKGDILVTEMTRPEFGPIMNKAAAIVTDEGGLTSHAAIVSRELKVPCIVGTKCATVLLRDGDLVIVDTEKGVVKKIE